MVEEAVEEVLDLVRKAAQQVKPTEINPDFEFLIAEGKLLKYYIINYNLKQFNNTTNFKLDYHLKNLLITGLTLYRFYNIIFLKTCLLIYM